MPRCARCNREIAATTHRQDGFTVDGYRLHTGKTKKVSTKNDNGENVEYQQLYEPKDVHVCADCFGVAAVREFWLRAFPAIDALGPLCE